MTPPKVLQAAGVMTLKGVPFEVFWTTPDVDPFSFPSAKSTDLQTALNAAIDGVLLNAQTRKEPRGDPGDHVNFDTAFPIPITIADVSGPIGAGVPVAHYNWDEVDFVASEAKVPIMYAAFQLRHMVRRFATELGISKKADLFSKLKKLDPIILGNDKVPMLKAVNDIEGNRIRITNAMRLPQYEKVFEVTETGGGLDIKFKGALAAASLIDDPRDKKHPPRKIRDPNSDFGHSLFEMIATSDDHLAGTCVHGIGYGFLNGALDAGGYFERPDPKNAKTFVGLWVGGDYAGQEVRGAWSVNDSPRGAKLAGTTHRFAQMMAAIKLGFFTGIDAADEMSLLLKNAVTLTNVWENASSLGADRIKDTHYLLNKVGFAELGRREGTQPLVFSEVSALQSNGGKNYVVAWQNLQTKPPVMQNGKPAWNAFQLYSTASIARIIRDTVRTYEGLGAGADPFP